MTTSITFRVAQTPSANVLRKGCSATGRWHKYKRIRDSYHLELLGGPRDWREWPPDRVRLVKIHRYGKRQLDDDNLVAGCKPLRDALHLAGVCLDDAEPFARFEYWQTYPGQPGITLTVELLDEPCQPTAALLKRWKQRTGRTE